MDELEKMYSTNHHNKVEEEKESKNSSPNKESKNAISTSRSFSNTDMRKKEKANRDDLTLFLKKASQKVELID